MNTTFKNKSTAIALNTFLMELADTVKKMKIPMGGKVSSLSSEPIEAYNLAIDDVIEVLGTIHCRASVDKKL
jgi:hypothetical protein